MDGYGGSSERVCVCVGASKIINGMNPLDVQREFYILKIEAASTGNEKNVTVFWK